MCLSLQKPCSGLLCYLCQQGDFLKIATWVVGLVNQYGSLSCIPSCSAAGALAAKHSNLLGIT